MLGERNSGVLMHFTSLPCQYGIGDLGWASLDFVDFLEKAGQRFWQFLPTVPSDTIYGSSPYMGLSSAAGNPLLISPDMLQNDGLLVLGDLSECPAFSEYLVDYKRVKLFKDKVLRLAFERFQRQTDQSAFDHFCKKEVRWLDDYALFMALRERYSGAPWNLWPSSLVKREPKALTEASWENEKRIEFYKFEQFCFYRQWTRLQRYAQQKGIALIGDIPIYVSYDSVDVWANQDCFELDNEKGLPRKVAGVPPDYFSETGQRWGNPLYRWKKNKKKNVKLISWWKNRFQHAAQLLDVARIDHFRGFEAYFEIDASEETAINGRWCKGPGESFFKDMGKSLGALQIIAEDLGVITPEVEALREKLEFPGMKILQFAFNSDPANSYLPHNYSSPNCIVYTGTHDNNTTLGWFLGQETVPSSKRRVERYVNSRLDGQIHWDLIRLAFSSIAAVAIVPMQDVLGFGEDCRMNTPGTTEGNWCWRCAPRFLNDDVSMRLRSETEFYGRFNHRIAERKRGAPAPL